MAAPSLHLAGSRLTLYECSPNILWACLYNLLCQGHPTPRAIFDIIAAGRELFSMKIFKLGRVTLAEGPEWGKMGTEICPFFGWENGISCTGTGIH